MQIISRSGWGARAPKSGIVTIPWSGRVGVAIHHSATSTDATVRALQDGDMDSDGFIDLGYNLVVDDDGRVYEGRQGTWTARGAHAGGANSGWVGVCWIGDGRYATPSAAAKSALRWVYDEACRQAGWQLDVRGHGQVPGQATECPGARVRSWIADGLPASGGSPTPTTPSTDWIQEAIMSMPTIEQGSRGPDAGRAQALLAANGYPPHNTFNSRGEPDEIFGPGSTAALRDFQEARSVRNSVTAGGRGDGICGRYSWTDLLGA